tara:strand:+ start:308 stop:940 length:633 start_codon:yes stop_codon:yes gene_type:complete
MKENIKPVTVEQLRVKGFDDNFSYLLYTPEGDAAIVDPTGNANVILDAIRNAPVKLHPRYILITHSHRDHISALTDVLKAFPAPIAAHPDAKVNADTTVNDGQLLPFGSIAIECIYTPGHTNDSICYRTTDDSALFTGDTLFIDWCGYCHAETMFKTMREKLFPLADSLIVWSGHDYGHVPYATLGEEKLSNPYLRTADFSSFKKELKKL